MKCIHSNVKSHKSAKVSRKVARNNVNVHLKRRVRKSLVPNTSNTRNAIKLVLTPPSIPDSCEWETMWNKRIFEEAFDVSLFLSFGSSALKKAIKLDNHPSHAKTLIRTYMPGYIVAWSKIGVWTLEAATAYVESIL